MDWGNAYHYPVANVKQIGFRSVIAGELTLTQISNIMRIADDLYIYNPLYVKSIVSNETFAPRIGGLAGFKTAWGTTIEVSMTSDHKIKITVPKVPYNICMNFASRLIGGASYQILLVVIHSPQI